MLRYAESSCGGTAAARRRPGGTRAVVAVLVGSGRSGATGPLGADGRGRTAESRDRRPGRRVATHGQPLAVAVCRARSGRARRPRATRAATTGEHARSAAGADGPGRGVPPPHQTLPALASPAPG